MTKVQFNDAFYDAARNDLWEALGVSLGGYSGSVDDDLIAVIKAVAAGYPDGKGYTTDIATATDLPPNYVEMIQYILCSAGWAEYGTSPRGCWIDHAIDKPRLLASIDEYYRARWVEADDCD